MSDTGEPFLGRQPACLGGESKLGVYHHNMHHTHLGMSMSCARGGVGQEASALAPLENELAAIKAATAAIAEREGFLPLLPSESQNWGGGQNQG